MTHLRAMLRALLVNILQRGREWRWWITDYDQPTAAAKRRAWRCHDEMPGHSVFGRADKVRQTAIEGGAKIPEQMRPILEQLKELGTLADDAAKTGTFAEDAIERTRRLGRPSD